MTDPDISNLANCIEDARLGGLDQDPGPADFTDFFALRGRLEAVRGRFSPLYQQVAFDPFVTALDSLGESNFNQILVRDPTHEGTAGLMLDIAQALLQRGERFDANALGSFEEVVSDLYDGFLSAEDRRGVAPPDKETAPPLVKFGNPGSGPYTWPADATETFGLQVAVVNLPPANTSRGLLAWPTLGHETAGHDILHADDGLLAEVSDAVRNGLKHEKGGDALAGSWAERIDETASDVFGILNMGPAAGIGLIGYFRGLSAAFGGGPHLRNSGPSNDPHPADILRGFLASATVQLLEFDGAQAWSALIEEETEKDLGEIRLAGRVVDASVAKASAQTVAKVIVTHPMKSLELHALGDIQTWRNTDEDIAQELAASLTTANPIPSDFPVKIYAAHMVAAATIAALTQGAHIPAIFGRMLDLLKAKNDANPTFGPLLVRHPGNISRDRAYMPFRIDRSAGGESHTARRAPLRIARKRVAA
jgi:hypothetical protein